MTQKQTDARRMLKRGASIAEINTYLRRMYGSSLHTCELARLRRGDKPKADKGAADKPPAPKPKALPAPQSVQLTMAVDAPVAIERTILLHPNGTWRYGD